MKTGIELIAEERQRQIEIEGWTPNHDSGHIDGELAMAACCYAIPDGTIDGGSGPFCKQYWPFEWASFKPVSGSFPASRIKELSKAGALIAAEIDRLNEGQL